MPPSPPPIAHIYAPRFPHEPIEIIGNSTGLGHLINVLIDAVGVGDASGTLYTSDLHDSEVRATCLRGERRPEEWQRAGSPRWDVDDPLIARIMDLTEENSRLRRVIAGLRRERKSIKQVDHVGGIEATDGREPSQN